jgi:hypothetical protein
VQVHITPKKDTILLLKNLVKMAQGSEGKSITIQIQRPNIIRIRPVLDGPATEDEEFGTGQRHGMEATTVGLGTIDHDASPLSRFWNGRSPDQLE